MYKAKTYRLLFLLFSLNVCINTLPVIRSWARYINTEFVTGNALKEPEYANWPDSELASTLTDFSQVGTREPASHLQVDSRIKKVLKRKLSNLGQIGKINVVRHRWFAKVRPEQAQDWKWHRKSSPCLDERKREESHLRIAILEPSSGRGM